MAPSPPKKAEPEKDKKNDKGKGKGKKPYEEEDELPEEDQALQVSPQLFFPCVQFALVFLAAALTQIGPSSVSFSSVPPPFFSIRAGANGAPGHTSGTPISTHTPDASRALPLSPPTALASTRARRPLRLVSHAHSTRP